MSICYEDKSRERERESTPPSHGFANLNICKYTGIAHLKEVIKSQSQKIQEGLSHEQYLGFQPVTKDEMKTIDILHASIGKSIRFRYFHDTSLLITKLMPTSALETSHAGFGMLIFLRTMKMGIPEGELWSMAASTYYAENHRSSKEGDTSFKPCSRPKATDWPSIVIESGFSESLQGLRSDANWWLTNSHDGVKIVILIALEMATKSIQMEKWLLAPAANGNGPVATKAQEVVILPTSSVTGAPLTLEFENIHLRPPTGQEKDIVLTAGELSKWADHFWGIVQ
jgi:hypothetical protein